MLLARIFGYEVVKPKLRYQQHELVYELALRRGQAFHPIRVFAKLAHMSVRASLTDVFADL